MVGVGVDDLAPFSFSASEINTIRLLQASLCTIQGLFKDFKDSYTVFKDYDNKGRKIVA